MKDFVLFLVKELVTHPDDVNVEEIREGTVVNLIIDVNPEDKGFIIGKQGRTINTIRTLAKTKAIKDNVKVFVSIREDLPEN